MTTMQAATLAIAVLGAVLGIINTWHGLDKTRVKLKVRPAHAIPVGVAPQNLRLSIEVTNLSAFAVTIDDVGILYHGLDVRGAITQPFLLDGGTWPRRLEPRSSVSVYSQRPKVSPEHRIRCAYARTQCGVIKTGTSPALEQIALGQDTWE